MSLQIAPTSHFDDLWDEALRRYKLETGNDLLKLPLASHLLEPSVDPDTVVQYIEEQNKSFKTFRTSGRKILRVLTPIVHVVHLFIDAGAEGAAASDVVPGGKAIFVAVGVLLQAAKGVSDLYDTIESLLRKIKACLARVQVYLELPIPPNPTLMDVLIKTFIQVFIVIGIVTKYCNQATDGNGASEGKKGATAFLRRMKDYFRGILGRTDVKDALQTLEELTKEEQLVVAADTNTVVRKVQSKVAVVYDSTVVNDLRSWLRPPNEETINFDKKRQSGSCLWFFDDQFDQWKEHEQGVYWVYGHAGSGKSVLSSSVIERLRPDPNLFLAYFFFDFSDNAKQDCRALASSLVFQLAVCSEECLAYIQGRRSSHSPAYEELLAMLSGLLSLSGRTFIVIDALDECPEPARDKGLLRFFEHLCTLDNDKKDLHLLVTSRPEADIRVLLPQFSPRSLSFHDAFEHRKDIALYIATQLDREVYRWSDATKAKVQSALEAKSNGMFLWVDLQLQYLRRCAPGDVDRVLGQLPLDLNGTYERILKNFPPQTAMIDRARHVFECVAFANRPLFVAEVLEILSVNLGTPAETCVDHDVLAYTEDPESLIVQLCPGFLEVVGSPTVWTEKIVQFIHFSVQEYLTSPELKRAVSPACHYMFDEYSASLTLARICVTALDLDGSLPNFQLYATDNWDVHISSRNEDDLSELLSHFLRMGSTADFGPWSVGDTAFHHAARLGLCRHMKRLLEHSKNDSSAHAGSLINARNTLGSTALHLAAKRGHTEASRFLLDNGALIDDIDNDGSTPLHFAVSGGHMDIVRVLLKHPAVDGASIITRRCRARGQFGHALLHDAALAGHAELCRILLDHGALVDARANDDTTPLHFAAAKGHLEVVHILLEYAAKDGSNAAALRCRARDSCGRAPLHSAARGGYVDVCRLLLDHGALVDDIDIYGDTPLHAAEDWGRSGVVRTLLEHRMTNVLHLPPLEPSLRFALRMRADNDSVDGPWRAIYEEHTRQFEVEACGSDVASLDMALGVWQAQASRVGARHQVHMRLVRSRTLSM